MEIRHNNFCRDDYQFDNLDCISISENRKLKNAIV